MGSGRFSRFLITGRFNFRNVDCIFGFKKLAIVHGNNTVVEGLVNVNYLSFWDSD